MRSQMDIPLRECILFGKSEYLNLFEQATALPLAKVRFQIQDSQPKIKVLSAPECTALNLRKIML